MNLYFLMMNIINKENSEQIKELQDIAQTAGGMTIVANLSLLAVFVGNPIALTVVSIAIFNKFAEPFRLGNSSISNIEKKQIKFIVKKLGIQKTKEYSSFKKYLEED